MTNILNRAKCKYSNNYVIGQWLEIENQCFIIEQNQPIGFNIIEDGCFNDGMLSGHIEIQDFIYEVEKETRSINFSDMLASDSDRLLPNGEKDLRIFASLSDDGKGGDLVEVYEKERILANYTVKWSRCGTNALCFDVGTRTTKKILGIQQ